MDGYKTILIIEDDPHIRRFLAMALSEEGWRVFEAEGVKRGLIEAASRQPDCVVLDLGLSDGDGKGFISAFRQWSNAPIIVLTARHDEQEKVAALDAGADDYMTKPFGIPEFLARLRVQVRRAQPKNQHQPYACGDLSIDVVNRLVQKNGLTIHLTPTEYALLVELVSHQGKVCTQRHLLNAVWGPNYVEQPHYLRIYMGHLRQKLEDNPAMPVHLLTEVGVGYRLV
ncbi:MAG: response regulator [Neisseriaceae bacterium]|nr:response regulator [Neisseriaceae bacterium]MBP6863355.1 response regulator [Neisseriaceae bacterium]